MPEPTTPPRRDRLLREQVHDPYKVGAKLSEPTVCPECGAVYRRGRWTWAERPAGAQEQTCQACHRIRDNYPAGEVILSGAFLDGHRDELLGLARHQEAQEKGEHPLNRIMAIEDQGARLVITTTDIHLPRRIGESIHRAYEGDFAVSYDAAGYNARVTWHRD